MQEVGFGSNYVLSTSNILVSRIIQEVGFGSNYVLSTSNILVPRIMQEVGFGSNYVLSTSNILVPRIMQEVGFGSNYVLSTSNILVSRIMQEVGFGSNYVLSTSNILVPRIMSEVGFGSNYVLNTSNILVKRITDEVRYTSNYVERLTTGLGTVTNYWTKDAGTNIYLNQEGNVGIGTSTNLTNKLHIYNTPSSSVRLETTTTGTVSIEFQRGANNDVNVDYRIICESDLFKIQSQDATNLYTSTTSELIRLSTSQITLYKNTLISARVGIGVSTIGTTHDLDVNGSARIQRIRYSQ
jgi:hypothetical protein